MKKRPSKKLVLNRETVRKLNDAELRKVVGGVGTKTCPCIHTSAGPSHPIFC